MKRAWLGISVGAVLLGALGACSTTVTNGGNSGGGGGTPESSGATPSSGGTAGAPGSGVGAGGSTGGDGGSPIGGTGSGAEPPPPGGSSPGSGGGRVFAINKLLIGDTDPDGARDRANGWKNYGFDIDHQITNCSGNACSEITDHCKPAAGGNPAFVYPDGHDGIDNSFGANILPILLGIQSDDSIQINKAIASGRWTLLFDLQGLGSGSEYDPLTSRLYLGANLGHTPRFDGSDAWPVRPESLTNPNDITSSKEIFTSSYVVRNTWVSGLGRITMPLDTAQFQGFDLDIQHAQLMFSLSADHTEVTNGVISGVIPTRELANEFRQFAGSFDQSLCQGGTIDSIVNQIEQASDIMQDGSAGRSDQTCDAISIGLGFQATLVTLGGIGASTPPLKGCH